MTRRVLYFLLLFLLIGLLKLESQAAFLQPENTKQQLLYGVWTIEEVALVSQEYQGEHYSISRLVDLYNREAEEVKSCIGMEIEYGRNYVRLGSENYVNPRYEMSAMSIYEYGESENFIEPTLDEFLNQKKIYAKGEENYLAGSVPLTCFAVHVSVKEENSLNYSGLQGVILNENTILIGNQGITFLAIRKNKLIDVSFRYLLYKSMNQNIVEPEWYTEELKREISTYISISEETKIDMTAEKISFLPPALWTEIEKLIYCLKETGPYDGWNTENRIWSSSGSYAEKVKSMGAKELFLFLDDETEDEIAEYTGYSRYSISYNQKDYCVFVDYRSEIGTVACLEKKGEEYSLISRFQVRFPNCAAIIPYEGELYFLNPVKNKNIQEYDGLEICKLGIQSQPEYRMVRFIPVQYQWKNLYLALEEPENQAIVDAYLEHVKKELISSGAIEYGQEKEINLFIGDEKESVQLFLQEETNQFSREYFGTKFYAIDLANVGEPAYIKRNIIMPESYSFPTRMRVLAYSNIDGQGKKVLSELYLDDGRLKEQPITLTQLWFKELNGKVYTFSLYYVSEYYYLLNVMLVEGGKASRIRTELLVPERNFIEHETGVELEENEQYLSTMAISSTFIMEKQIA